MHFENMARSGAMTLLVFALSACSTTSSTLSSTTDRNANGIVQPLSSSRASIQRPISDFLGSQGTAHSAGFFAAYIGWTAYRSSMQDCIGEPFAFIDYAGLDNAFIVANGGTNLATTTSGSVHQADNGDGTSTVSVELNTTKAQSIAYCFNPTTGIVTGPYFGHTVSEILAGGVTPALGSSHMSAVFTIVGSGRTAPLPDLEAITAVCPAPAPCFKSLKFTGTAEGPLQVIFGVREGTLGKMSIEQISTFHLVGRAGIDGSTAEFVQVQPAQ